MTTSESPRYSRLKYRAKKITTSSGATKWEVGVESHLQGKTTKFDSVMFGQWSEYDANKIAGALNQAVETFVQDNGLKLLERPLLSRIPDPDDPTMKTVPFDRLAQWLTATDKLPELWAGSLLDEITRVRNAVEAHVKTARNVTFKKDPDGTWHIHLA